MKMEELLERARRFELDRPESRKQREIEIARLADDDRFPALLSLVLEFEEDLTDAVARYDRVDTEKLMDAGGLATMRKFRADLTAILTPPPKDPEPVKEP